MPARTLRRRGYRDLTSIPAGGVGELALRLTRRLIVRGQNSNRFAQLRPLLTRLNAIDTIRDQPLQPAPRQRLASRVFSSRAPTSALTFQKIRLIPTSRPIAHPAELGSSTAMRMPSTIESEPPNIAIARPGAPSMRIPAATDARPLAKNHTA